MWIINNLQKILFIDMSTFKLNCHFKKYVLIIMYNILEFHGVNNIIFYLSQYSI